MLQSGLEEQARLTFLLQPVAVALDEEGVAVVQESVENGGGEDIVAEDLAPLGDELIGGDEHAALLVTPSDELEEEVGAALLEGQISELVEDEQLGLRVEVELVLEVSLDSALESAESSVVALTKSTLWPVSTAALPKAMAR